MSGVVRPAVVKRTRVARRRPYRRPAAPAARGRAASRSHPSNARELSILPGRHADIRLDRRPRQIDAAHAVVAPHRPVARRRQLDDAHDRGAHLGAAVRTLAARFAIAQALEDIEPAEKPFSCHAPIMADGVASTKLTAPLPDFAGKPSSRTCHDLPSAVTSPGQNLGRARDRSGKANILASPFRVL